MRAIVTTPPRMQVHLQAQLIFTGWRSGLRLLSGPLSETVTPASGREVKMRHISNGMPATRLEGVVWRKSRHSNPGGNCVELAELPGGDIALRNSRHPGGPALIYTRAEIAAFVHGAKDGDFDELTLDR